MAIELVLGRRTSETSLPSVLMFIVMLIALVMSKLFALVRSEPVPGRGLEEPAGVYTALGPFLVSNLSLFAS